MLLYQEICYFTISTYINIRTELSFITINVLYHYLGVNKPRKLNLKSEVRQRSDERLMKAARLNINYTQLDFFEDLQVYTLDDLNKLLDPLDISPYVQRKKDVEDTTHTG